MLDLVFSESRSSYLLVASVLKTGLFPTCFLLVATTLSVRFCTLFFLASSRSALIAPPRLNFPDSMSRAIRASFCPQSVCQPSPSEESEPEKKVWHSSASNILVW